MIMELYKYIDCVFVYEERWCYCGPRALIPETFGLRWVESRYFSCSVTHDLFTFSCLEMYCDVPSVTLHILIQSDSPTRFMKSRHVRPA
jgi:hypothetical protein